MFQVDRRGSREGKKSSLRKNKQMLNEIVTKGPWIKKEDLPSISPAAPPLTASTNPVSLFDAGCRLVNRQFDRDQQRVIQRALDVGVQGMVVVCTDFEKQDAVVQIAKQYQGSIYAAVGIHPDNIKRTNEKLSQDRLDNVRDLGVSAEVVAIYCGLDFSREFSTRYAQEKLLESQIRIASEIHLPVLIQEVSGYEKVLEILNSFGEARPRACIYSFSGTETELDAYISAGLTVMITGAMICDPEHGDAMRALVKKIPLDRLLIATDSPFGTPQTIEDAFVRQQRNEPSNIPYVLSSLAQCMGISVEDLSKQLRNNSKQFFSIKDADEVVAATTTDAPPSTADSQSETETKTAAVAPAPTVPTAKPSKSSKHAAGSEYDIKPKLKVSDLRPSKKAASESESEESEPEVAPVKPQKRGKKAMKQVKIEEEKREAAKKKFHKAATSSDDEEEQPIKAPVKSKVVAGARRAHADSDSEEKPVAPAPRKVTLAVKDSDSSEEDESSDEDRGPTAVTTLTYACKVCRKVLFGSDDLVSHRAQSTGFEVDVCKMFFIKPMEWMGDEVMHAAAEMTPLEGKIACPQCDAKLGRFSTASTIPCSCGRVANAPAFRIVKARLDSIVEASALGALALEENFSSEEDGDDMGQMARRKQKKKKLQRAKHAGNFSQFRNKST